MNIVKTLCLEPAPYDYQSSYTITFKLDPAVIDFASSYVNIPLAINETYAQAGNTGAVANVFLEPAVAAQVAPAFCNFRSVRLRLDGTDLIYTQNLNRLLGDLTMFENNIPEERLLEYLSGFKQTLPSEFAEQFVLDASQFRTLFNSGNRKSLKNVALLRVSVKQVLDGFAEELRDLRAKGSIELVFELDNIAQFVTPSEKEHRFGRNPVIVTTTQTAVNFNPVVNGAWVGGNTQFIVTVNTYDQDTFPFGVGDAIAFTGAGARNITAVAYDTPNPGEIRVTTDGANVGAGADVIAANTCQPRFKATIMTQANVSAQLNQVTTWYDNETLVTSFDATHTFFTAPNYISAILDSSGVLANSRLLVFRNTAPFAIAGTSLANTCAYSPFVGTPGNGNPIPMPIAFSDPTGVPFTTQNCPFYVGEAVMLTANANLTNTFSVITAMSYSGNNVLLTFSPAINATGGGALSGLNITHIPAASLAYSHPERMECVYYKAMGKLDGIKFNKSFKTWSYDADTIPALPAQATYEHTFRIDPLCDFICSGLHRASDLTSSVEATTGIATSLDSYRLSVNGIDTTQRYLKLSGDLSFRQERLLNGFMTLYENLDAISSVPAINPLSKDNNSYTMLQDIEPDAEALNFKVALVNGAQAFEQRNLMIWKRLVRTMA